VRQQIPERLLAKLAHQAVLNVPLLCGLEALYLVLSFDMLYEYDHDCQCKIHFLKVINRLPRQMDAPTVVIYFDGSAVPNPGWGGAGYRIATPDGKTIATGRRLRREGNRLGG